MNKLLSVIFLSAFSLSVWAAEQTVTLNVKNMTCAMCPITVKKSLQKVEGVNEVAVSFDQKTATVTYNDEKTSTNQLTAATTNTGYPSTLKKDTQDKEDKK